MPARELEILGVFAFQLIADVVERMRLAILAEAGVVVRQMHLNAHDEVQLLPPFMVGGAVGNVGLGGGEAPGILVTGAIDTLPWVERCRPLAQLQVAMLVTHTAVLHVGVLQVPLQLPCHGENALHFPNPVHTPQPLLT